MHLTHVFLFTATALALAAPESTPPAQLARAMGRRNPSRNNAIARNNPAAPKARRAPFPTNDKDNDDSDYDSDNDNGKKKTKSRKNKTKSKNRGGKQTTSQIVLPSQPNPLPVLPSQTSPVPVVPSQANPLPVLPSQVSIVPGPGGGAQPPTQTTIAVPAVTTTGAPSPTAVPVQVSASGSRTSGTPVQFTGAAMVRYPSVNFAFFGVGALLGKVLLGGA